MTVTLEKEVEEPFVYDKIYLLYLTVFTDYEVSGDAEIETGRSILEYKETGVRYEIANIEACDFEGNEQSRRYIARRFFAKPLDTDTLKALQSFAEAHSGHKDDEIFEEARRSA